MIKNDEKNENEGGVGVVVVPYLCRYSTYENYLYLLDYILCKWRMHQAHHREKGASRASSYVARIGAPLVPLLCKIMRSGTGNKGVDTRGEIVKNIKHIASI